MTRQCGACKGSGNRVGAYGLCFGPQDCPDHACPVCQGSGRVAEPTEAEKRRDAMADAETLLSGVMDRDLPLMPEWRDMRLALWSADNAAAFIGQCYGTLAYLHAARSAAAAFRAVPGLREAK